MEKHRRKFMDLPLKTQRTEKGTFNGFVQVLSSKSGSKNITTVSNCETFPLFNSRFLETLVLGLICLHASQKCSCYDCQPELFFPSLSLFAIQNVWLYNTFNKPSFDFSVLQCAGPWMSDVHNGKFGETNLKIVQRLLIQTRYDLMKIHEIFSNTRLI